MDERGRIDLSAASIPMQTVGPVMITGPVMNDEVFIPLATYETPLFPSVKRGCAAASRAGGIQVTLIQDCMTRSILLEAPDARTAFDILSNVDESKVAEQVAASSRFAKLDSLHPEQVGNLIFLRISISSGDASGHNMATLAAQNVLNWFLETYPVLHHVSISGNYCTDKKVSAVNAILGRGKRVIAEVELSEKLCKRYLRATPTQIHELNTKKNLVGTLIAGGLRSANAHYANMLLAFYLATGQDAANIVEGSQGITYTDIRDGALYFSCTLPNIIVGTVGNGKDLPFVQENLKQLGCLEPREPGKNSQRLAAVAAAAVLGGELSLMAAQCNPGELMDSHQRLERGGTP